jgi:hypothetical protein
MLDVVTDRTVYPFARNLIGLKRSYFDDVVRPVLAAVAAQCSSDTRTFAIAGKRIAFRFYSARLAERLSLAFAHHAVVDDGVPDLTISIWDSVASRVAMAMPWTRGDHCYDPFAEPALTRQSFIGAYVFGEPSLNLYDADAREAYFWLPDAQQIPGWVQAAPFRSILHWFFSPTGLHLVHGAVLSKAGRAVLVSAKGGSGKSTTALSCVAAGMDYLGDDYVGVTMGERPTAHCLYNSAKVGPEGLEAFPEWARFVRDTPPGDNNKSVLYMAEAAPGRVSRAAPLTGILIPVPQKAERTYLAPASKMQAILALAPTTVFQLALSGGESVTPLRTLVESLPCHFLMLGPDRREVGGAVDAFCTAGLG